MKRITAIILGFALVLGVTACGGGAPETQPTDTENKEEITSSETTEEETYMYPVAHDNYYVMDSLKGWIKLHGRQVFTDDGQLTCDWSGNGFTIRVKTEGTTFKVQYFATYDIYFSAHIDGVEVARPSCPSNAQTFEFEVPAGEHTISIYKEKEISTTIGDFVNLQGITFEGEILEREADKDLYFEVIGDSISCGDGSLGVYTAGEKWKNEDHSATHSFSFYMATKLNADFSIVGRGGIGLIKPAGDFTMDILYGGMFLYRGDKTKFVPERMPDFIVVEMGANDTSASTEQEYYEKLKAFIEYLRKMYGADTPLVWAGKGERNYGSMKRIMLEKKADDPMLFAVQYDYGGAGSAALTTQTSGHPDAAGQERFADAIIKCLKDNGIVK